MQSILSETDLQAFLHGHDGQRVVVFKHSTQCPISRSAYHAVLAFCAAHGDVPVGMIRVIEERPLSLHFAATVGVRHASPQAVVLADGQPQWQASHYDITVDALEAATLTG